MKSKQYTIRINDPELNEAIRAYAQKRVKSINETVLESLIKEVNYNKPSKWQKYSGKIKANKNVVAEFNNMRTVNPKA
jgi:hypothetical protein